MTERCEDLDLFFDRELEPEAELVYRDHLASCSRCQEVLLGRMLEAAVVGEDSDSRPSMDPVPTLSLVGDDAVAPTETTPVPSSGPPAPSDGPTRLRRRVLFVAAAILPAAAAAVMLWQHHASQRAAEAGDRVAIQLAAERYVDVRFTAAELDRHRTQLVMRTAHVTPVDRTERISLDALGALNQRAEKNALVGAYALNGDLVSAQRTAADLPRTAASLADRAAVELLDAERGASAIPRAAQGLATEPAAERANPAQVAAAERALSLTSDALRLDPRLPQALWNQAIALRRLGLSLAAASRFDRVAALREPGWDDEAVAVAAQLRAGHQRDVADWIQVKSEAQTMILGGPILRGDTVARAPSVARDSFYLALATAATAERIDALAGLAGEIDARFASAALTELVARVRRSDLGARAALSDELRSFIAAHRRPEDANGLRARAIQRGAPDIALASLLAVEERAIDDADLALFDQLLVGNHDPWWNIVALARRAYRLTFWRRDYPAVDAVERRAEPLCKAVRSRWCDRILLYAGDANSQMGRADLASEQLAAVLRQTRIARAFDEESAALDAVGQETAIRVADDIDAAAVADAYLEEVALRKPGCSTRLQRLDAAANAALQHHRFDEAARLLRDTDALERGDCKSAALRLNGEAARARLVLTGRDDLGTLRAKLAQLEAGRQNHQALYLGFLSAAAMLVEDRASGEAALRKVIEAADADPGATNAQEARAGAFEALVDSTARSRDASALLGLLSRRLGAPVFDRCALGIASWNHLVVAVIDADGRPAVEVRDIPDGAVMIPARDAVSPELRARLASCRRVDVVAAAPYFGAARLLDDRVAWVYHIGAPRGAGAPAARHELMVSDVVPPEDLHLPLLQPLAAAPGAEILSGPRATPANVLAAMKTASLAVIVAHGFTAAEEPTAASLVLSPDAQGDYLLTASKVRAATFASAPVVVLAGCEAGRVQVSAEPWSLATSFRAAGARTVIAPTEPIPDARAGEVFRSLIERIRAGADPVDAFVAERRARGDAAEWLSSIVIFE